MDGLVDLMNLTEYYYHSKFGTATSDLTHANVAGPTTAAIIQANRGNPLIRACAQRNHDEIRGTN
uniref:Uncharacterized protein n=1 Tax=Pristionchus pacificus TaxID=54126 RepID=A0A2A6C8F2_PRIPA|eukprot:PDM74376.1 hypothetical protein PRIPAC_41732 [Pristionchus pacificus]